MLTRILAISLLSAVSMASSAQFAPLPDVKNIHKVSSPIQAREVHALDATFEMDVSLLATVALAEDMKAPTAVMWVVRNRARAWHRGSLLAAVTFGESFGTRKVWIPGQPSEWRPIDLKGFPNHPLRKSFENTATLILLNRLKDPTGGATNFHRIGSWDPPWAPELSNRRIFGSHYFYRAVKVIPSKEISN
jgi:hypothetical protein